MQIEFLHNGGSLVTACTDDTLNLWDFKKRTPELVQTLQLSKEHITTFCMEFQDKWLYFGTEKGNTLVMNMELFTLSGYQIAWNKGMDPLKTTHPGAVTAISVNPADSSKILIGYATGLVTLWDLPTKKGEQRYSYNYQIYSICWHMEGRQFVCSYGDGALVTWNVKLAAGPNKPQSVIYPHGKKNKETNKVEKCDPIEKVRATGLKGQNSRPKSSSSTSKAAAKRGVN
jgi:syntaxin-binding protein 5